MPVDWSDQIVVAELADEPALSDELAGLLDRLEKEPAHPHVVLNFQGVSYVNSSNLAQLLKLRKVLAASERSLRLCSVKADVMSVIRVTGLEKLFHIAPDPLTAITGLQMEAEG